MNFDLGTNALRKLLLPRTYTLRGIVLEMGSPMKVQCTLTLKEDITLEFWAKPLLPLSFSYEEGDEVIVEVRSFCEAYVLGLAKELEDTDITTQFYARLGKNVIKGNKDGTSIEFIGGDGGFLIEHTDRGTVVRTSGVLTLVGDSVILGDGTAPGLNCMTACPLQGLHTATQNKVMF